MYGVNFTKVILCVRYVSLMQLVLGGGKSGMVFAHQAGRTVAPGMTCIENLPM